VLSLVLPGGYALLYFLVAVLFGGYDGAPGLVD
jgi:hypothetical protein